MRQMKQWPVSTAMHLAISTCFGLAGFLAVSGCVQSEAEVATASDPGEPAVPMPVDQPATAEPQAT